ncbi:hypothetical protein [Ammonifex degensii]|nr:hypothetical protein [Ammonifex degensii]
MLVDHRGSGSLPGAAELVRNLHANGRRLAVVTRHSEKRAREFLE